MQCVDARLELSLGLRSTINLVIVADILHVWEATHSSSLTEVRCQGLQHPNSVANQYLVKFYKMMEHSQHGIVQIGNSKGRSVRSQLCNYKLAAA